MSWFKDRKELEENLNDDFNYDPNNPYTLMIEEEEFIEVKIGANKNDNKSTDESKLPTESND
jgi:hypothetical protein